MSFIDFARSQGVEIDPEKFYPSDKIRRCGTVGKPKSGNGAYFWDGKRGWVMDWSGEAKVNWFEDKNAKPWTDEEKHQFAVQRQVAIQAKDAANHNAAQAAEARLCKARLNNHPYLEIKGFREEKGLVDGDTLLIPMRNVVTNRLQGYQAITWDLEVRKYDKRMATGMRAKNAVFYIGGRGSSEAWLVEGYATGLSLYKALRSCGLKASVVVCFSASNLVQVADQIPGNRFVFADNDESQTGQKAAEATGLPWAMADEVGMDANDLHKKHGLFAVVRKIMQVKKGVLTSA